MKYSSFQILTPTPIFEFNFTFLKILQTLKIHIWQLTKFGVFEILIVLQIFEIEQFQKFSEFSNLQN